MIGLTIGRVLALAAVAYIARPLLAAPKVPDEGTAEAVAEALVRRYRQRPDAAVRSCPRCGPRPEPDALFCSSCGAKLRGA